MSILLIRHGETAGNANRIVQVPETPLSERGSAQARLLAGRLASSRITRIMASDLARAQMTAEAVRDATKAPLELDDSLQERNFGDLRGTAYADLTVDLFGPDYDPPGGESWSSFHERVDRAWDRIRELAAREAGDLAVVTHGLVCHSLVSRKLSLSASVLEVSGMGAVELGPDGRPLVSQVLRFGNTALTVIAAEAPWAVSRLACVAHLDVQTADDEAAPSGI